MYQPCSLTACKISLRIASFWLVLHAMPTAQDRYPALTSTCGMPHAAYSWLHRCSAAGSAAGHSGKKLPQQPFSARCLYAVAPRSFATPCRCCGHGSVSEASAAPSADKTAGQNCSAGRSVSSLQSTTASYRTPCRSCASSFFAAAKAGAVNGGSLLLQITLLDTQFFQIIACKRGRLAVGLFAHCSRHAPPFRLPARQLSGL